MILYYNLYTSFFLIGLFAMGGGYATLPLIEQYIINQNKWIDISQMSDIVSISQMTPGPIAINAATFVGSLVGNITGSIVATIAVITPQIIILIISLKYIDFENKYVKTALMGVSMSVNVFMLFAAFGIMHSSLFTQSLGKFTNINNLFNSLIALLDKKAILIFFISGILYLKKVDIIKIIIYNVIITTIFLPILIHFSII